MIRRHILPSKSHIHTQIHAVQIIKYALEASSQSKSWIPEQKILVITMRIGSVCPTDFKGNVRDKFNEAYQHNKSFRFWRFALV